MMKRFLEATTRTAILTTLDRMKKVTCKKHKDMSEVVEDLAEPWGDYTSLFFFLSAASILATRKNMDGLLETFIQSVKNRQKGALKDEKH